MTFSQLLVLLEAQWLLSCAEHDRDIRTHTSAEHANQTDDPGGDSGELREVAQPHVRLCHSLSCSLIAHFWPHHNWRVSIGNKIVVTLYSNRVTSENIKIHTPSLSPPFKVGVFVVF